jgi:hypothetical protein
MMPALALAQLGVGAEVIDLPTPMQDTQAPAGRLQSEPRIIPRRMLHGRIVGVLEEFEENPVGVVPKLLDLTANG